MNNPFGFRRMPTKACGPNSAKWALNAIGRTYDEKDGLDYLPMFPQQMVTLLLKNGVETGITSYVSYTDAQKLEYLHDLLDRERPVLLYVRGRTIPHWVVLAGRNDAGYFIFDREIMVDRSVTVPIGNRFITRRDLLHKWSMPFWGRLIPSWRFLAIPI